LTAAVLSAVTLVAVACGSTVPQAQQVAANAAAQGGLGGTVLPPGGHVNAKGQIVNKNGHVIGTTAGGLTGASGGGSGSSGATTGAVTSSGNAQAPATSSGKPGPGVTGSTIALGLQGLQDQAAANSALGGSAAGGFDYKRGWHALIAYQNSHGGIDGLRIVPTLHMYQAFSSSSFAQQDDEACKDWTQDHHVFAVLASPNSTDLLKCVQDAGAVFDSLDNLNTLEITPYHREFPYFIEPDALDVDRAAATMVDSLSHLHYFAKGEKLGVVTFDDPRFKYALDHGLVPALRRHNVDLADSAYLHFPGGYGDYGQMSNDAANAAVKFKSEGIDHVVFIDKGGNAAFFFMEAAEKQQYRPRYGMTSQSGNQALISLLGSDSKPQLHDSLSIGWVPPTDASTANDPTTRNPTRVLCMSIMRKAGVDTSSINGTLGALAICDALWSLAAALDRTKVINQATFGQGVNGLGGSYAPGLVWSTKIDPSQHDGVSSVADMAFVDSCTCFKYTSRPYSIP
jgi:hypothetical protein